jgi:hypothetical protein
VLPLFAVGVEGEAVGCRSWEAAEPVAGGEEEVPGYAGPLAVLDPLEQGERELLLLRQLPVEDRTGQRLGGPRDEQVAEQWPLQLALRWQVAFSPYLACS